MLPQYTTIVPTIIFLDNHFDFIRLLSIAAVALQKNLFHTFLPYLTISYHIVFLKLSPYKQKPQKQQLPSLPEPTTANTRHSSTQKRPSIQRPIQKHQHLWPRGLGPTIDPIAIKVGSSNNLHLHEALRGGYSNPRVERPIDVDGEMWSKHAGSFWKYGDPWSCFFNLRTQRKH